MKLSNIPAIGVRWGDQKRKKNPFEQFVKTQAEIISDLRNRSKYGAPTLESVFRINEGVVKTISMKLTWEEAKELWENVKDGIEKSGQQSGQEMQGVSGKLYDALSTVFAAELAGENRDE